MMMIITVVNPEVTMLDDLVTPLSFHYELTLIVPSDPELLPCIC